MSDETYTTSSHLDLQYIIGAITHTLNTKPELQNPSDKGYATQEIRILKAERRKMQLAVGEIQKNWSDKSIGR